MTRTDWEVSISYGHRSTTFYAVTRQFRNDQAAKAFADNAVRRVIKHHCDFACCGEWTIPPCSAPNTRRALTRRSARSRTYNQTTVTVNVVPATLAGN